MASTTLYIILTSALFRSNEISYAFSTLLLYDHVICLGEEVEYFWSGPWTLSRILYLGIRYLGLGFALFTLVVTTIPSSMPPLTQVMIKLFAFILPISTLCQSVITLRVWYLFSRSPIVRSFAVAILAITTVVNALIVAMLWKDIRNWVFDPFTPSTIVWVYVPSLFIHTTLFMLKVYRFVTSSVRTQTDTLLWRFVKEGMFMYAFAMASLLFGIIGLSMTDASDISTRTIAAEGSPIVASIAVAVARVMLSIRSVAATAHVDPEWLLNHAELSRVQWRRGAVDGEIIVEAGAISPPVRSLTLGAHESFMLSEYGTQELESNENI